MASNQVIEEVVESNPPESNEENTEYNSVAGINPNPLVLLICLEKIDGEPLLESLLTPRHLNMFCLQYAGERPFNLEFLNRYEVCHDISRKYSDISHSSMTDEHWFVA